MDTRFRSWSHRVDVRIRQDWPQLTNNRRLPGVDVAKQTKHEPKPWIRTLQSVSAKQIATFVPRFSLVVNPAICLFHSGSQGDAGRPFESGLDQVVAASVRLMGRCWPQLEKARSGLNLLEPRILTIS
jgi:hypothetical protein